MTKIIEELQETYDDLKVEQAVTVARGEGVVVTNFTGTKTEAIDLLEEVIEMLKED